MQILNTSHSVKFQLEKLSLVKSAVGTLAALAGLQYCLQLDYYLMFAS